MPYKDKTDKIGIIINRRTKDKLVKIGRKCETYDDIINRLLSLATPDTPD